MAAMATGIRPTVIATDTRPTATAILRTGMLPTPTHPVIMGMRMRRDVPMRVAIIATEPLCAPRRPDVGRFAHLPRSSGNQGLKAAVAAHFSEAAFSPGGRKSGFSDVPPQLSEARW